MDTRCTFDGPSNGVLERVLVLVLATVLLAVLVVDDCDFAFALGRGG